METEEQQRKRKPLDLAMKIAIIKKLEEKKMKQVEVAKEFGLSTSTVNNVWKTRGKIIQNFSEFSPSVAKVRKPNFPKTEAALVRWFDEKRAQNVPLDGKILKAKAMQFATEFKEDDFKGSDGWFERWKARHGISFSSVCGESGAADNNVMAKWLSDVWPTLKEGYHPDDIYNCNETGIFYKMLPDKTFHRKGTRCSGGKLSKERLTLLLCANASGTDKMKPLVIGKYENPRCFASVKKSALAAYYFANSRAWMTQEIFTKWLQKVDFLMRIKRRRILLLVDNCTPHKVSVNLSNVKLAFFPPNLTSLMQPMDQGIINETKKHYRSIIVRRLIEQLDNNQPFSVDMLEAILNIAAAGKNITPATIKNCFIHSQLLPREDGGEPEVEEIALDSAMLARINLDEAAMQEYVQVDDNVATYEGVSDEQIIAAVEREALKDGEGGVSTEEGAQAEDSEGEDDPEIVRETISSAQALDYIKKLQQFALQQDREGEEEKESDDFLRMLYPVENYVMKMRLKSLKQPKINACFSSVEKSQ